MSCRPGYYCKNEQTKQIIRCKGLISRNQTYDGCRQPTQSRHSCQESSTILTLCIIPHEHKHEQAEVGLFTSKQADGLNHLLTQSRHPCPRDGQVSSTSSTVKTKDYTARQKLKATLKISTKLSIIDHPRTEEIISICVRHCDEEWLLHFHIKKKNQLIYKAHNHRMLQDQEAFGISRDTENVGYLRYSTVIHPNSPRNLASLSCP